MKLQASIPDKVLYQAVGASPAMGVQGNPLPTT